MTAHSHTTGNSALTARNGPSPRMMALAYRIWAYASPREWNCTSQEIADELGIPQRVVTGICAAREWNQRMRATHNPIFWDHGNLPVIAGGRDVLTARERMTFAGAAE